MPKLISDAYQKLNYELHRRDPSYGANANFYAPSVAQIIAQLRPKSLLDYGCGKGALKPALQALCPSLDIREYDPAVPGKTAKPAPADVAVCFDVMEHIEPERLADVLVDLRRVTLQMLIVQVSLRPAHKTLSDGRNAHLIVQPKEWWIERFSAHFKISKIADEDPEAFTAIMTVAKK